MSDQYEGNVGSDYDTALQSLYHVLSLDIAETSARIGRRTDEVVVVVWKMLLRDMLDGGARRGEIMEAVRTMSTESRRRV